MKRFVKFMALAMTMALVFGMTVSAQESPATTEAKEQAAAEAAKVGEVKATTADGTVVTIAKEAVAAETMKAKETYIAKAKEAYADKDVNVVGAVELTVPAGTAGDVTVTLDVTGVQTGKTYVLVHVIGNTTELIPATVVENGKLSAVFKKGFSPVFVVEVVAKANTNNNNNNSNNNSNNDPAPAAAPVAETAVSPKTGEVLPVAGIMAVICLAGAVFCTKKSSYNK